MGTADNEMRKKLRGRVRELSTRLITHSISLEAEVAHPGLASVVNLATGGAAYMMHHTHTTHTIPLQYSYYYGLLNVA